METSLQYRIIANLIESGSTVLDLGCGNGELLLLLKKDRKTRGQGIELNEEAIYQCVEKGISVFQGDIEQGLIEYVDASFDYVILNQSMQEIKNVDYVLKEALRVGRKVIVGFPNFAYIKSRFRLLFEGIVPVTSSLPYHWYDSPNIHFLSIKDFILYCKAKEINIIKGRFLSKEKEIFFFPNLFADNAIFMLNK